MTDPANSAIRQAISNQGLLLGCHKELLKDTADAMLSLCTNVAALSSQSGTRATGTKRSLESLTAQATNTNLNMQTMSSELRALTALMARCFQQSSTSPLFQPQAV
ncbi:hypothetical protein NHX12_023380 [Muraenolepis orangiensis]|uniref:Uncharacterized protein n=1 Tax=Muraenolepis orangiensis TaxID=630683 RepID=A0A9Q0EK15_9TELE|nr:hypothetical protein NHX12_023380 [Muraenolepis orangiensis]